MPDFIRQARMAMSTRNTKGLADVVEGMQAHVVETGSIPHAMLILELSEYLAEKAPPFAITALRASVTAHRALGDPAWDETSSGIWQEEAKRVWQKAFDALPEPNLLNKANRNNRLDAFYYTEKCAERGPLYVQADKAWKAYLETQSRPRQSAFNDLLQERMGQDILGSHVVSETVPQRVISNEGNTPEPTMKEITNFADDFSHWAAAQPKSPRL
jgi:hypothetical protein